MLTSRARRAALCVPESPSTEKVNASRCGLPGCQYRGFLVVLRLVSRVHDEKANGPVPIGWALPRSGEVNMAGAMITLVVPARKVFGNAAHGWARSTCT